MKGLVEKAGKIDVPTNTNKPCRYRQLENKSFDRYSVCQNQSKDMPANLVSYSIQQRIENGKKKDDNIETTTVSVSSNKEETAKHNPNPHEHSQYYNRNEAGNHPWYVISPSNTYRIMWDLFSECFNRLSRTPLTRHEVVYKLTNLTLTIGNSGMAPCFYGVLYTFSSLSLVG